MSDKHERRQRLEADRGRRAQLREPELPSDGQPGDLVTFLRARLDEDEQLATDIRDDDSGEPFGWYDPARELRKVNAGRAILAEYIAVRKLQSLTDARKDGYRDWILRQLAAVYRDHPDYLPEWKP